MPDKNTPASGFQYRPHQLEAGRTRAENRPHLPRRRRREYPKDITGLDIAKGISPSLAKRTVAMALDGMVADLADPIDARCEDRIHQPRRPARAGADPARRRACAGRSGAGAVAGHAGHHRPGDRERILLRLLPQRAVHARRFAAIEKKMREIVARDKPFTKEVWVARKDQAGVSRQGRGLQGRTGRRHSRRRADQDLLPGRLVRSVPRPAHDLDRQGRQRLQADEGGGRLLARRQQQSDADAHLRHGVRQAGRARRLPQADRGSREARPPQARPRTRFVSFPGRRPRRGVLARQGLDDLPGADRLYAPPPDRRLRRGQRAADARQVAVGDLGPLGLVPREHVRGAIGRRRGRGQALVRDQADELPGPCADLQARPEELPRTADPACRIRRGAPLRAIRRDARADARARLYAGRRAYLLHRRAACRRVPQDQRPDPVDLCGFRLRRRTHGEALDPAGEARRHRRDVGSRRARDGERARAKSRPAAATASRPRSIPAKARSTGRSSNMCCATPSAATGNAAPPRSTSTCRNVLAPSTSTPTAPRRRR